MPPPPSYCFISQYIAHKTSEAAWEFIFAIIHCNNTLGNKRQLLFYYYGDCMKFVSCSLYSVCYMYGQYTTKVIWWRIPKMCSVIAARTGRLLRGSGLQAAARELLMIHGINPYCGSLQHSWLGSGPMVRSHGFESVIMGGLGPVTLPFHTK